MNSCESTTNAIRSLAIDMELKSMLEICVLKNLDKDILGMHSASVRLYQL